MGTTQQNPSSQDYTQIPPTTPWAQAVSALNFALNRIYLRLNTLEGRQGSPTIYSDQSMAGNKIVDGPDPQTDPAPAEFVTKAYTDTIYLKIVTSAGAPSRPATGYTLYIDTSDGNKLKWIGTAGTVTLAAVP